MKEFLLYDPFNYLIMLYRWTKNKLLCYTTATIKVTFKHSKLMVSVSDLGIGVDESEKMSIFGAFYQGKNAKSQAELGSGLGLTIVKETVEQLNGELKLEDNDPHGCCFTVILPIQLTQGVN